MSDLAEWERQLQANLTEIRRNTAQLGKAVAAVRGRAEIPGLAVEVDAHGTITDLRITRAAMRWTNTQLAKAITDTHRRACADATAKTDRLLQTADPRIRRAAEQLRGESTSTPSPARQMSEEEIQAADDAYFERHNREGWNAR
ncbi:hypothetical protein ACFYT3_30605 [Nocardia amikacinitolerans]|uniref:hypothetical protein n=1 Tax=Nocardia amikacinitolerans TaxID=756689 RepID=UPI003676FD60